METWTVAAARAEIPEVRRQAAAIIEVRADLAELRTALRDGEPTPLGGLPELKALEARFHDLVEWFPARGIQLKGFAPLLVDFPALVGGREVLLCWLEGEEGLEWWHLPSLGFMGRRPLADPA